MIYHYCHYYYYYYHYYLQKMKNGICIPITNLPFILSPIPFFCVSSSPPSFDIALMLSREYLNFIDDMKARTSSKPT